MMLEGIKTGRFRPAIVAGLFLVATIPLPALNYQNASTGLPASHLWDCGIVFGEFCNNSEDTGGWTGVAMADVNGDGFEDVVAVGRDLQGYHVWLSDGAGNWTESSAGLDPAECHGQSEIAFGDIDNDGDMDIGAVRNVNAGPGAFDGDGVGTWTDFSAGLSGGGIEGFTFGDFDGDGNLDIATSAQFGGPVQAFLGDGAGTWTKQSRGLPGDVWAHRMTAIDLDGDGRDELVDTAYQCTSVLPGDPCGFLPMNEGVHVWTFGTNDNWSLFAEIVLQEAW